ncbi:hypothetical protein Tco_0227895 [Tanacetum coccineum]
MLKNQKKFNGQNFKRWQQEDVLLSHYFEPSRFLNETAPQVEPPKECQPSNAQVLLHDIHAEGMTLSETFQVAAIIEKGSTIRPQKNTDTPDSTKANMVEHAGSPSKSNSKAKGKGQGKNDKKGKGKACGNRRG